MQQVELRPQPVEPTVREREMGSEEEKTKKSRGEAKGDDGTRRKESVEGHVTSYHVKNTSGVLCFGVECHAILFASCHVVSGVAFRIMSCRTV